MGETLRGTCLQTENLLAPKDDLSQKRQNMSGINGKQNNSLFNRLSGLP